MSTLSAAYWRDQNRVPVTTDGVISNKTIAITGNNATVATALFSVTGTVEVRGLWGVVTTTLENSNNTAAYWRLNDQTAQVNITLNTGTLLSGLPVGSTITKKGLAAAALTKIDNTVGAISEPTTLETTYFSPFLVTQKKVATTNIEFVYTTNDTPTTGGIQFFIRWLPVSVDANITVL